jgi:hypothetical protein
MEAGDLIEGGNRMRQVHRLISAAAASSMLLSLVGAVVMPSSLVAQDANTRSGAGGPGYEGGGEEVIVSCDLTTPSTVQRFRAQCFGTPSLDVDIADCCIPGDHFQLKVKAFDALPNIGVTTSPGPADVFGEDAKVYNYGGTPENPDVLDATIECSYLHGVNLFPASASVRIKPEAGTCEVSFLGEEDQIQD